jgi:hypothetical protein
MAMSSVISETSNQTDESASTIVPNIRWTTIRSMSVSSRSRWAVSGRPPSIRSSAIRTTGSSAQSSMRPSCGAVSIWMWTEWSGTWANALAQVNCPTSMTSISIAVRCSATRRVLARSVKVSMARRIRRSWSVVNFVGRVKSTVRNQRARRPWRSSDSIGMLPSLARAKSFSISLASRKPLMRRRPFRSTRRRGGTPRRRRPRGR